MYGETAGHPKSSRILIVEDNARLQMLITGILASAGYTNVTCADDGQDALEKLDGADPDLILLDIMMPRLDGWGVLEAVRPDPRFKSTPILVQTALDDPEQRARAFKLGATDLVTKPINAAELIARVGIHLENKWLIRNLKAYHDRVEKELRLAHEMQMGLIPTPQRLAEIGEASGMRLSGHFQASSEIGGDLWGIRPFRDGRLAVYMVDFSGHGATAALNTFRLHTLMEEIRPDPDDPGGYMEALNRRLKALLAVEQYATMFYGVIDRDKQTLTYAAAAATTPLILYPGDETPTACDPKGFPTGVTASAVYDNRTIPFTQGCTLFLYSDALTETAMQDDGPPWGGGGVATAVTAAVRDAGDDDPLKLLIDRFYATAQQPLLDDLSALMVRWL